MTAAAILGASDLTPRSAQVGGRAARIAAALNMRLILAYVATPKLRDAQETLSTAPAELATAEAEAPGGPLRALSQRLLGRRPRGGAMNPARALNTAARGLTPRPEVRLLVGDPAEELATLARAEGAALMVLGLHRERRVLDVLRRTSMEKIVLAAPTPVLIAHRDAVKPYRRVLALTDFSPASAAALRAAARIAPAAEFHAIHALQLPLGARFTGHDGASDDFLTQAEQMRAAFLAFPGLPELAEPPEIVPGGVHEVLEFRQMELGADLVCIGTHSGRDPGQLGHYARDLMRAPPTDLLVAKPG